MACKSKTSAKGTNQKRKTGAKKGVRNVAYPELAGEGEKGTVIVPKSKIKDVESKYQSKKSTAQKTPGGLIITGPDTNANLDLAVSMHKKNKTAFAHGKQLVMINPNASRIVEIVPGEVYADFKVYAKPRYAATIHKKNSKGKWVEFPFRVTAAKRAKKTGTIKT